MNSFSLQLMDKAAWVDRQHVQIHTSINMNPHRHSYLCLKAYTEMDQTGLQVLISFI